MFLYRFRMDSFNHHMMDTDYGHNVYGPPLTNQIHTNLPPEGILMQGNTDAVKDNQYPRESIITSNVSGNQIMDQYQQSAPIDNEQLSVVQVNNGKIETEPTAEFEGQEAEQTKQEVEPMDQTNESADLENTDDTDTKPADAAESTVNDDDSIKTTTLEIEPIDDSAEASTSGSKIPDGEVDQNQCRVCMSKVNLVNIFTFENNVRICDNIMTICSGVKILERDFLPHYVCTVCLDKVKIAIEFKSTCESTDKELRSKLKRSKSKVVRRRRDFILVDCELSSEASDNNAKDDDEFKISEDEVVAEDSEPDSDVSFPPVKRKRGRPKKKTPKKKESKGAKKFLQTSATKAARSTRNSSGRSEVSSSTKSFRHDVVFVEAPHLTEDEDEEDESEDDKPLKRRRGRKSKAEMIAAGTAAASKTKSTAASTNKNSKIPHKKRAIQPQSDNEEDDDVSEVTSPSNSAKKEQICQYCEKTFPSRTLLKEHKKTHVGEKPLSCNICQKGFKQRVSLDSHIQKHKDDDSRTCKPCDKQFASRMELRKHQQTVHEDEYTFECEKCKRSFTTKTRLEKHKESKCPGFDTTVPRKKTEVEVTSNLGRDLFKCVAPLTTTYWSDSYSE